MQSKKNTPASTSLDLQKDDIQGIIARSYPNLPAARFVLLKITNSAAAKQYLGSIVGEVTTIAKKPTTAALQVAITAPGLAELQVDPAVRATFPREFLEGVAEEHRQFVLGDIGASKPTNWEWGGPNNDPVHVMLMLYAADAAGLDSLHNDHRTRFTAAGFAEVKQLDTTSLADGKEHFGFKDGISQPIMEGLSKANVATAIKVAAQSRSHRPFKAGEFVLGYINEYGIYTDSPFADKKLDQHNVLPAHMEFTDKRDVGRNGSYLVYRQMSQDVHAFWNYLDQQTKEPADSHLESTVKLGAKMVGRWPSGAPMATCPHADNAAKATENDFDYWDKDRHGLNCPFGSHIRRANPRDWLETEKKQDVATDMVRKHRIIRRGRSYGPPVSATMDPAEILANPPDGQERGLHFISIQGAIERQFEFLQNSWIKSPKFGGLYKDSDPIIGLRNPPGELPNDEFTVPDAPVRRKYTALPEFVTIKGGAYFFLPGIQSLKFISGTP